MNTAVLEQNVVVDSDDGRLAEILNNYLPADYIDLARKEQAVAGKKLAEILLERSMVPPEILAKCIAEQANLPTFSLINENVQADIKIDKKFLDSHKVVPISDNGTVVRVGVVDPFNRDTIHAVSRYYQGKTVEFAVISHQTFQMYLESTYIIPVSDIVKDLDNTASVSADGRGKGIGDGLRLLLKKAVVERCSDIHVECSLDGGRIKFRKNGHLFLVAALTEGQYNKLQRQIKVNANIDITEIHKPKDGQIEGKFLNDANYLATDFRVSVIPNATKGSPAPSIVIRVLDRRISILPLEALGIAPHVLNFIHKAKKKPYGMIIVAGPTGSGKSTTIYSTAATINTIAKNFISVEDPVECRNYLWKQIQVDTKGDNKSGGMSFVEALKAILRHDPNIIFCGEMRDPESAKIAFDAANTGHLVFTTLHANNSVGVIPRLQGMGIDNAMIESAVIGTMSQRLARMLCSCKELYHDDEYGEIYKAKGCSACNFSGYKGRAMVSEYFPCNLEGENEVLSLALNGNILKAAALAAAKYSDMRKDMVDKVRRGLTSVEELEAMF